MPHPPSNFSERLKLLSASDSVTGERLQELASFALNLNQLTRLAKLITANQARNVSLAPLSTLRLGILSNSTIDLALPAIIASAARHGIALELVVPPYDQVAQEALDPASRINTANLDAVLFAIDFRGLPLKLSPGDADAASASLRAAIAYLQALRDGIHAHSNAVCIFQTFAPPAESLFGSLDRCLPGTLRHLLDSLNHDLAASIHTSGDVLLDVAALAECVGLSDWHAPDLWNIGKIPFSCDLIPLYAEHVARTLGAMRGKSRKVLVLDLDNTLWGGVIGDDGLEGIKIAQGDARGEAHLAVQRLALDLRQRGIILAVSSKNTDATAREPFERHSEMLLKLHHIAVFQANWNDKATNIASIADELRVGIDSIVFLDDNPVERNLVRSLLPQVAVPELPEDPAFFARTLSAAGYFEATTFATDDLKRAGFYQDNARRASLQDQIGGIDEYLAALDMTITFQPFDVAGRNRIVQLINKSNQYNLTTRRYTEPAIDAAMSDPRVFTLQVRLSDTFGDNGMISVVICRPVEDHSLQKISVQSDTATTWEIDTWLMSCRVLGRKVEHMVLAELVRRAREAGIQRLLGVYLPSGRNHLVLDHYAKLGFSRIDSALEGTSADQIGGRPSVPDTGATYWELFVDTAIPTPAPMKVISHLDSTPIERVLA